MDRHPQQLKRKRQDRKRRTRNIAAMSALKTHIKQVLQSSKKSEAEKFYGSAVKSIDKAVKRNLIHKNTGSRRKSQITRHINSLV